MPRLRMYVCRGMRWMMMSREGASRKAVSCRDRCARCWAQPLLVAVRSPYVASWKPGSRAIFSGAGRGLPLEHWKPPLAGFGEALT